MDEIKNERIQNLFSKNKGYARTKELKDTGLHTSMIKKLEEDGHIIKIVCGLYRRTGPEMDHHEEIVDVSKIVPKGVICLLSALSYYELSTYQPWEHYVAIHLYLSTQKSTT